MGGSLEKNKNVGAEKIARRCSQIHGVFSGSQKWMLPRAFGALVMFKEELDALIQWTEKILFWMALEEPQGLLRLLWPWRVTIFQV